MGELKLPEDEKFGRIIFEVEGSEIDAAGYSVEDGMLTITFDNGMALNGKLGRKGQVSLLFNVEESSSELELVEVIELEDTVTKTFIIKRSNANANAISKNGEYKEAKDYIEWVIDVNTELADLKNAVLVDLIPSGLNVDMVEIIDLEVTTKNIVEEGAWEEINLSDSNIISFEDNELTLKLGDLNREAKRIKIRTSIAESGDVTFVNTASLKVEGVIIGSDSDTLSFNRVTGITKSGQWKNDNEIEWKIEFRGTSDEGFSDLVDIFTVPNKTKLVLDEDSVKLNGNEFIKDNIEFSTEDPNIVIFKDIPNSTDTQTLSYTTKVIFENEYDNEEITIENKATYNDDSDGASVKGTRGEYVSKDNGRIYGDASGDTYIEWKIEVNNNDESWKNVEIEENIPDGFEFVKAMMGVETLTSESTGNITTIVVGKIAEPKTIVVTTKLIEKSKLDFIENVMNKATISYDYDYGWGIIGGGILEGPYTEVVEGNFKKTGFENVISKESSNLNYENQTIDWEVDYKTYNNDVDGLLIEDTLTGEQVYKEDSFSLTLNDQPLALSTPSAIGFVLEEKSFKITLPSNLNSSKTYNNIILTYQTKFDLTNMDDQNLEIILNNNVKITNDENVSGDDSPIYIEKWISKNGQKSVSKESGENRIFNWEVQLNPKGKTITKDQTIVDTLTGMQKYLEASIKIYQAELKADGKLSKVSDGKLTLATDYTIDYTDATELDGDNIVKYNYHSGMKITFLNDITTPIILEYQTEAVGISEESYMNNIAYNDMEYPAKIKYDEHNQYITKDLLNDRNGNVVKGDILKWKLTINSSLSEIHNFKLEDVMSEGLVFIDDSLVIKPSVDGEDSFVRGILDGDNSGKEGYKLTKDFVDKKYTIEYETLVFVDPEKTVSEISNDVYISGYSLEKSYENESVFNLIGRSQAGGSGYTDNEYNVKIIKVDADSGDRINKEVTFKLITETKIGESTYVSEEELVTDTNGEITITLEENTFNTYYIEEVKAPAGYVMDPERIEITNGDSSEIRVANSKIKTDITGTKVWKDGPTPKPTIYLQLYRNGDKHLEPVVLANGSESHIWENLDLTDNSGENYEYTIDEVDEDGNSYEPENYEKSISDDGLTITNKYIISTTSVTGTKEWVGGPSTKPTIELQLYRNGVAFEEPVTLVNGTTSYTWENLDKTDKIGEDYKYTVDEVNTPENYGKSISDNGLEITNTYESPKNDIVGRKNWVNGELNRPEVITFQLYRQIGDAEKEMVGQPVELPKGTYEYNWKDQDRTDTDGRKYTYSVEEIGVPENYTKVEEGMVVTNTYVIPKTDITASKEWINGPSTRPTIELQLYKDGVALGEPVVLENGVTEYTWTDLDKTDLDGRIHVYTVDEVEVPNNYIKEVSEDGLTIANTYSPPSTPDYTGSISIKKMDKDDNKIKLEGAEFELRDEAGKLVQVLITDKDGKAEAEDLDYGEYTLEETKAPEGYILDSSTFETRINRSNQDEVFEIYNEKEPVDPEEPIDPEEPVEPEDPTEPTEPNKPGNSDEFEDFDGNNPAGGIELEGPQPILPKTGSDSMVILLMLGVTILTAGLLLKIRKISKRS